MTTATQASMYFRIVDYIGSTAVSTNMGANDVVEIYAGSVSFNLFQLQYTINSSNQNTGTAFQKLSFPVPGSFSGLSGNFRIIVKNPSGTQWFLHIDSIIVADTTTSITLPTIRLLDSVTNVDCKGASTGAISLTASGGTSYTYHWNTGETTASISGKPANTYTVTVTDASTATATASITITEPAKALTIDSIAKINVACYGQSTGSAAVYTSGGTPTYQFIWSTTQTNAFIQNVSQGNYTVTVRDANGCTTSSSVSITQPASALSLTLSSTSSTGANGTATAIANGGTSPYSYAWSTTPTQTTPIASNLAPGPYAVIVTDGNGCTKTDTITVARNTVGIADVAAGTLSIYPNPANDKVYVELADKSYAKIEVMITDMSGRTVIADELHNNTVNVSSLSAGVYLIRVNADKTSFNSKLIIRK
jgi:hypothetical protein